MAYRLEKDKESGERQLVIDGWEKGIADSPYSGITSLKNLNVSFFFLRLGYKHSLKKCFERC